MPLMIPFEIAGDIYEIAVANKSLIKYINSKFFPYERIGLLKSVISELKNNDEKLKILADLIKDLDKENLSFLDKTDIYKILQSMIDNRTVKPTSHFYKITFAVLTAFALGSLFAVCFFDKI